ncbi:MAG: LptF/LptG family permease [Planctomycetes bacterium]|nr:LptF/LptG family permease [Planctomycetota bacterium]
MKNQNQQFKSRLGVWLPFGLWRIDWYFIRFYVRTFLIILLALAALVAIGDMFQRFDDFVMLARRENQDLLQGVVTFLKYYGTWVPQLVFQYMLPVTMLVAASITATAAYAGPQGNNEYTMLRSAGVPVLRAFFPLIFPAVLVAATFQGTRDLYLPSMVRQANVIGNALKSRTSNPTSVTMIQGNTIQIQGNTIQTAAIGWFSPDAVAHNLILEVRDTEAFQRGDTARGDNDFVAYRAASARLEAIPDSELHQWVPLDRAEVHTYTRFTRKAEPWVRPVVTSITPAMIERQPLGDAVSSWRDLLLMEEDNPGARFEMHWRLADPVACCLLILWGTGLCMGRMLRGSNASFIQSIALSMFAAALFYIFRLAGRTLWESGTLTPVEGVWYPLLAAAIVALPIALWMEC